MDKCTHQHGSSHNISDCRHIAIAYEDSAKLVATLEQTFSSALHDGQAVIVIACRPLSEALSSRLQERGLNIETLQQTKQLLCIDAEDCLQSMMIDGEPDREVFDAVLRPHIEHAKARFDQLIAFGELVNILWRQGNYEAANLLENWWNELIARYDFSLVCGYHASVLDVDKQSGFAQVCKTHSEFDAIIDHRRLDQALNLGLREVMGDDKFPAIRQQLSQSGKHNARMTPALSALLSLDAVLPHHSRQVRAWTYDHYQSLAPRATRLFI